MALKTLVQKENKNVRPNPSLTRKTRNKGLIEAPPLSFLFTRLSALPVQAGARKPIMLSALPV